MSFLVCCLCFIAGSIISFIVLSVTLNLRNVGTMIIDTSQPKGDEIARIIMNEDYYKVDWGNVERVVLTVKNLVE